MTNIKKINVLNYFKEFIIYFIFSMFIHAQIFIHDILDCDEFGIIYRNSYKWNLSLGRFGNAFYDMFLSFLGFSSQSTYYSIVVFSLFISIGIIIIFYILNIKDSVLKTIVAFPCISFQSFLTTNTFRSAVIAWIMSFTLPCISALLLLKLYKNINFKKIDNILLLILSCILLVFAIGFRQSALSIFCVILLLDLVNDAIDGIKNSVIFKKAIFYLLFIILSSLLYLFFMGFFQKLFNINFPREYPDLNTILTGIFKSYARYAWLIVTSINLQKLMYVLLYIIILYEFIIIFIQKKTNKLMYVLFLLILPLAIGLAGFMQKNGVPIRGWMALLFIYIIPVFFYEKIQENEIDVKRIKISNIRTFLIIVLLGHSLCNFYNTQNYYQICFARCEAARAYAIELATTIKNTKDYSVDKKFCIVGSPAKLTKEGFTSLLDDYNLLSVYWAFVDGLKKYGAIDFELDNTNMSEKLINSDEVKNMPTYPNYGSIKVIDNIVVIKLSN